MLINCLLIIQSTFQVQSSAAVKLFTVRGTAFEPAKEGGSGAVENGTYSINNKLAKCAGFTIQLNCLNVSDCGSTRYLDFQCHCRWPSSQVTPICSFSPGWRDQDRLVRVPRIRTVKERETGSGHRQGTHTHTLTPLLLFKMK